MDDDGFGFADDLTPRQEKFAVEYARTGNAYRAAIAAGYGEGYAKASSYKMLDNAGIFARVKAEQAIMMAEQRARLSAMANEALDSLAASIRDTAPGSMARVRACELVLDRAGHKPVERMAAAVATRDLDGMTDEEARRVLAEVQGRLGINAVFVIPEPAASIEAWANLHSPREDS